MWNLELFHKQECPYSSEVRKFIDRHDLRSWIRYCDVGADEKARLRLIDISGGEQIPCLALDSRPLLETDRIIEWLKKNLVGMRRENEAMQTK